jgi:L-fuculose-phosphate aldolase
MERIYRYRMTTTSGGNLSLREDNGDVWITPARLDKGALKREDIVRVRSDGSVDGPAAPSSEMPFHLEVYARRPDVRGIVHAHPVALVAFSIAQRVPDTRLFHQSRHVCGQPAFAPYCLPGSQKLGDAVAGSLAAGLNCAILENHGVVTAGGTFQDAFRRFETLEFTGKTIIKASHIGAVRYLDDEQIALPAARNTDYERQDPTTPSSAERELRRRLAEYIRRAYRQRLFISTQGSFSARIDATSFLITPYECDRGLIEPADLVLVSHGRVPTGVEPSRATRSHAAIYAAHPEIGAVINAYPVNASAFGVTAAPLDTRTIPESYLVVRQPARVPYGPQFTAPDRLAASISPRRPAAILENDGVLVTGASPLDAFDRLEVLESTAEAIINCRAIGAISPMGDDTIRELEAAFGEA